MHPIINNNKKAIIELCKQHGIASLCVFGSVLRNDFGPESDVDFLVSYVPDQSQLEKFDAFLSLKNNLEHLLKRDVDILDAESIDNKYLRFFINQEKQLLYGEA